MEYLKYIKNWLVYNYSKTPKRLADRYSKYSYFKYERDDSTEFAQHSKFYTPVAFYKAVKEREEWIRTARKAIQRDKNVDLSARCTHYVKTYGRYPWSPY